MRALAVVSLALWAATIALEIAHRAQSPLPLLAAACSVALAVVVLFR